MSAMRQINDQLQPFTPRRRDVADATGLGRAVAPPNKTPAPQSSNSSGKTLLPIPSAGSTTPAAGTAAATTSSRKTLYIVGGVTLALVAVGAAYYKWGRP